MKQSKTNYDVGALVPEYRSIAVRMEENSRGIAALNVHHCHLLEICNRDPKRNRTAFARRCCMAKGKGALEGNKGFKNEFSAMHA